MRNLNRNRLYEGEGERGDAERETHRERERAMYSILMIYNDTSLVYL